MFKLNDYVFSLNNGIGIVKDKLSDTKFLVKYDGIELTEDISTINLISDSIINQIKSGRFKDYYSINTLDRARECFLEDKISDLTIFDKNIYAKAHGISDYSLSMIVSDSSIRSRCTCPVGKNCKHSAATLLLIESKLNKLTENKVIKTVVRVGSYDTIVNLAISINPDFTQYKDLDRLKELKNIITESIKSDIDMTSFINFMDSYRIETNNYLKTKLLLIKIIAFSSVLRPLIYNTKNITNKALAQELHNSSRIIPEKLSNYYPEDIINGIIYSIVNDDYVSYLKFITNLSNRYYADFLINNYNEDILKEIVKDKYITKPNNIGILKNIFKNTDIGGKKYIKSEIKTPFLDIKDINLDIKDAIQFLPLVIEDEEKYRYVVDNYNIAKLSDIKGLYHICYYLLNSNIRKSEKNIIKALLEDDYNARYIVSLIKGEAFKIDNIQLFLRVFSINYNMGDLPNTYYISHKITLGDGDIDLFECLYTLENENVGFSIFNSEMEGKLKELCQSVLNTDYKYLDDYNRLMEKYKKKEQEAKIAIYKAAIDSFDLVDMSFTLLDSNFKVNIDYIFDEEYNYNGEVAYTLSLKVYIDGRKYVVKDMIEFLNNIRDSKTFRYGKELEFNHRLDNFNEKEIKILEFLLLQPEKKNTKQFYLSLRSVEELLKLLKDRYITYKGNEYFVRLDKKNIEISIDDNYILKNSINEGSFVVGENTLYLFESGYVDKVLGEYDYLKLIRFTIDNKNMDVSLVKNEFIDKIYSRYYDVITINPLIEDEFRLSLLRIDAYFDLVKGAITCETKLYKDNILISSEKFLSDSDRIHLGVYLKHLNKIGFVNYELLSDSSKIIEFFRMDFSDLRKVCNVYLSESIKNKKLVKFQAPIIRISYENNIMNAFFDDTSYTDQELYDIMRAIKLKKRFVLLNDDRIIELNDSASELYDTVCDLRLDMKNLKGNNRINIYDSISALAHSNNCKLDEYVNGLVY